MRWYATLLFAAPAPVVALRRQDVDEQATARNVEQTEAVVKQTDHNTKQVMNMVQSVLLANAQQIAALNNLQQEMVKMRDAVDKGRVDLATCHKEVRELREQQEAVQEPGSRSAFANSMPRMLPHDGTGEVRKAAQDVANRLEAGNLMANVRPFGFLQLQQTVQKHLGEAKRQARLIRSVLLQGTAEEEATHHDSNSFLQHKTRHRHRHHVRHAHRRNRQRHQHHKKENRGKKQLIRPAGPPRVATMTFAEMQNALREERRERLGLPVSLVQLAMEIPTTIASAEDSNEASTPPAADSTTAVSSTREPVEEEMSLSETRSVSAARHARSKGPPDAPGTRQPFA